MLPEKGPCNCVSIIMILLLKQIKGIILKLLEECKYVQEKIKTENCIDDDLEKSESDGDYNDEIESDINNDEYDEWFVKSILIKIKA